MARFDLVFRNSTNAGTGKRGVGNNLYKVHFPSANSQFQSPCESVQMVSGTVRRGGTSALGLIGLNYGDSSDSEDDHHEQESADPGEENSLGASTSGNKCCPENLDSSLSIGHQSSDFSAGVRMDNVKADFLEGAYGKSTSLNVNAGCSKPILPADEDSSRLHVFCLEHAVEVEQQLGPIGGVDIFLVCHPGK